MNNLVARAALVGSLMVLAHSPDARAEDEGQHHMARDYLGCSYSYGAYTIRLYRKKVEAGDKDIGAFLNKVWWDGSCNFLKKGWAVTVEPYPEDPLLIYVKLVDQSTLRGRYLTFKDVVE